MKLYIYIISSFGKYIFETLLSTILIKGNVPDSVKSDK